MATSERNERREQIARTIWETSRRDEGTISATGANHVADAVLAVLDEDRDAEVRWGVFSYPDGRWYVSDPPGREAAERNRDLLRERTGEACDVYDEPTGLAMQNALAHQRHAEGSTTGRERLWADAARRWRARAERAEADLANAKALWAVDMRSAFERGEALSRVEAWLDAADARGLHLNDLRRALSPDAEAGPPTDHLTRCQKCGQPVVHASEHLKGGTATVEPGWRCPTPAPAAPPAADDEHPILRTVGADLCHHCGQPPEDDGDHSCPCPYSDADCPTHRATPDETAGA